MVRQSLTHHRCFILAFLLISEFVRLIDGLDAFFHPLWHRSTLEIVIEELHETDLEVEAVSHTHWSVRFACVVEQPARLAKAFHCHEILDTLIPRHMTIGVVVHDEDWGLHLVHIE